jgi:hypothetical protein
LDFLNGEHFLNLQHVAHLMQENYLETYVGWVLKYFTWIGACRDNKDVPKFMYWVCGGERCGNGTHTGIWISNCDRLLYMCWTTVALCRPGGSFVQTVSYISNLCKVSYSDFPSISLPFCNINQQIQLLSQFQHEC